MQEKMTQGQATFMQEAGTTMGPRLAYVVTAYHVAVLIVAAVVSLLVHNNKWQMGEVPLKHAILAATLGAVGGALTASRYVVHAVRSHRYDPSRLLWQITTPIHSGVLGLVSMYIVRAGLLTLTTAQAPAEPQYTAFVIGFAFLVGFASEVFVKRLIAAAEALLGERGDLDKQELQ